MVLCHPWHIRFNCELPTIISINTDTQNHQSVILSPIGHFHFQFSISSCELRFGDFPWKKLLDHGGCMQNVYNRGSLTNVNEWTFAADEAFTGSPRESHRCSRRGAQLSAPGGTLGHRNRHRPRWDMAFWARTAFLVNGFIRGFRCLSPFKIETHISLEKTKRNCRLWTSSKF